MHNLSRNDGCHYCLMHRSNTLDVRVLKIIQKGVSALYRHVFSFHTATAAFLRHTNYFKVHPQISDTKLDVYWLGNPSVTVPRNGHGSLAQGIHDQSS